MFGNKKTALPDAAYDGNFERVVKLVQSGADLNSRSMGKISALMWASSKGHKKIADFLLAQEGIDVNAANIGGMTALMLASKDGHPEIVKALLAHKDINVNQLSLHGNTALICAAGMGQREIVEILLQVEGITLDATYTDKKHTPMTISRQNGHLEIAALLEDFASNRPVTRPTRKFPRP